MLTLKAIREKNQERQKEWDSNEESVLTPTYFGNALAGEVGEACNVVKKLERARLGLKGTTSSVSALSEELADALTYLDLLAAKYDIDLSAAYVAKFNKVSEKNGFKTRF